MDDTNDNNGVAVEEEAEEVTPEADLSETTDWEAEAKKARGIAQRLRTKLTKATEKKVVVEEPTKPVTSAPKTGELDETQLDYLDLKGISDSDEIDVIQKVMAKTGQTVRQALKDEYVQTKLEKLRGERAVKDATPSSTRRSGGQTNDVASAIAKYEATGVLPDDFELRSAVVNKMEERSSVSSPSWRR